MSNTVTRPNGHRWVQFTFGGKRHTIRLGAVPNQLVLSFQVSLDRLILLRSHGLPPDAVTLAWMDDLPERAHRVLVKAGLIETYRDSAPVDCGALADIRINRPGLKASTKASYGQVKRVLVAFFKSRTVDTITPADCDAFRDWLAPQVAPATLSKRCRTARSFFTYAVRAGWIKRNPWEGMMLPDEKGDRKQFVTVEQIDRILATARDRELKALIVFARFGTIRVPSEAFHLKWTDIDRNRMRVRILSPKTERFAGKSYRDIPLFADLVAALDRLPRVDDYLFPSTHQYTATAIRKRLVKVIEGAGLQPWVKPWQNLRASCATMLAMEYGQVLAARWCGHSVKIAESNYWMPTNDEFIDAAKAKQKAKQPGKAKQKKSLPTNRRTNVVSDD